ncbi:RNase H family protein [Brevibacterium otitidis]|uniref:RNase H family protein n=1 Tax=Brevibacterium otitidis TaxID=53364 RepID=A0ABV5X0C7_9MICO|nr:hypothetical protein GCM10023233_26100 [Brevibacterium otitidis]
MLELPERRAVAAGLAPDPTHMAFWLTVDRQYRLTYAAARIAHGQVVEVRCGRSPLDTEYDFADQIADIIGYEMRRLHRKRQGPDDRLVTIRAAPAVIDKLRGIRPNRIPEDAIEFRAPTNPAVDDRASVLQRRVAGMAFTDRLHATVSRFSADGREPTVLFTDAARIKHENIGCAAVVSADGGVWEVEFGPADAPVNITALELRAVCLAAEAAPQDRPTIICTDSQSVLAIVRSACEDAAAGAEAQQRHHDQTCASQLPEIHRAFSRRNITLLKVPAHARVYGNELADNVAVAACQAFSSGRPRTLLARLGTRSMRRSAAAAASPMFPV